MLLWPFNKYPGTDYETFNWEWILKTIKDWVKTMTDVKNSIEDFMDHGFKDVLYDLIMEHPEWVTTVMDGAITEPKINAEFLKTIINGWATPQMYGAVADGVTDDTQAFIDMLADTEWNVYYIPKGTYKLTGAVEVNRSDIKIFGAGDASDLQFTGNHRLTVSGTRCELSDFKISSGGGLENTNHHNTYNNIGVTGCGIGFYAKDSYIVQLAQCYFTYNKIGVWLLNQSYETVFQSCVIDNNQVGVMCTYNQVGAIFDSCTIEGNRNTGTQVGCGVFVAASNTRLVLKNCWFEENGTVRDSVDIWIYRVNSYHDMTNIMNMIQSAAQAAGITTFPYNTPAGTINIDSCNFWATPYMVMTGGYDLNHQISNCKFGSRLNRYSKPVYINCVEIVDSRIKCYNNKVINTDNAAITAQMMNGIQKGYLYLDMTITNATHMDRLLHEDLILYEGHNPFIYRTKLSGISGTVTWLKQYSATGTKVTVPGINGHETDYYEGATTIYCSTDGTSSGVDLFPAADTEYTYTALADNGLMARRNTTGGWSSIGQAKNNVYQKKTNTSSNRNLLAYNYGLVYALIIYDATDLDKMQGTYWVEFTDLKR